MKQTEVYKFKKNQKLHLDDIYVIQGLANGDWWSAPDPFDNSNDEETVTILRDIKIEIVIT